MKQTIFLILPALCLGACSEKAPPPPQSRTVAYFKAHKPERDSVIAACIAAQGTAAAQTDECGASMTAKEQVAREVYLQQRLGDKAGR